MAEEKPPIEHELLIVVLGEHQSGKTSVIDRLLGLDESSLPRKRTSFFKRGSVLRREGHAGGRKVVMVDTPGWWRCYPLIDMANFMKRKLVLSLPRPPHGAHAFLLTVMIDESFDEKKRKSVEEHLGLFGETVWGHTIVMFTRGGSLEGKTIEQHIESEGKALEWLLEKCGKRYCVFDNQTRDQSNVMQLLEKVDSVLQRNSGRQFELDRNIFKEADEKRTAIKERSQTRLIRMTENKRKRRRDQSLSMTEIRILLVGWVSSRKTSSQNTILGREESVIRRTTSAHLLSGKAAAVKVSVVDTPGWWKYFPAHSTPSWVREQLKKSLTLGSGAPHAVLLAVPADTTFLEEQRKITEDNMRMMFGEQVWRHTMVLFTCGDLLGDTSIEEHIESEGEPLRWLVEKCGNRYHVFDNVNRGDGMQVTELLEKIKDMVAATSSFSSKTTAQEGTPESREDTGHVKEALGCPSEGIDLELGHLLDKEWNKMDRRMEERMRKLYESAEANMRGGESMDYPPKFSEVEPPPTISSVQGNINTSGCGSAIEDLHSTSATAAVDDEAGGKKFSRQISESNQELLERVKETLEREWGRREAIAMDRACAMFLEMNTMHGVPSEPDEREIQRSREKVLSWNDNKPTSSGICSVYNEEYMPVFESE